jgi:transposase
MSDKELAERLVVKRSANGRCSYDEDAKRELVEACLQPGVSIAKLARDHGINANLLHAWISLHRKARGGTMVRTSPMPSEALTTFVPVVTTTSESPRELRLDLTLDNGIQADLRCLSREDVLALLPVLASLPCSASTRR